MPKNIQLWKKHWFLEELTIHPNPSTSYFNVITDLDIDLVELFDLTGKMVLSVKNTRTIDIEDLASGVYLSKIYYNNTYTSRKIIKE